MTDRRNYTIGSIGSGNAIREFTKPMRRLKVLQANATRGAREKLKPATKRKRPKKDT